MTILFSVLGLLVAASLVVAGYVGFAVSETQRLRSYREWSDRFFSLSSRILDHDLPAEWIDIIDGLNSAITSPVAANGVYKAYKQMNNASGKGDPLPADELEFLKANPAVADDFLLLARSAMLAITFAAPFSFGLHARSLMAENWVRRSASASAVKEVEKVKRAFVPRLVPAAA